MTGEPRLMQAVSVLVCPRCGTRAVGATRFCPADGAELYPLRTDDPLVGRCVGGYLVRRRLAAGGMGRVFLAEHQPTGRTCALKVLDGEIVRQPDALQRFRREATNQARLRGHPHVCELYEFGTTADGMVYIAMEFVEGESLRDLLAHAPVLPPARVADIVRQAASGLAAAHAIGLVHRDLKPDNVMLGRGTAASDRVKLIDFGISKAPRDRLQKVTGTGVSIGTPQFMSPEQLAADAIGPSSDIYTLGLLAFLMLAGALPFESGAPGAMARRMTGQLRTLREVRPDVAWPDVLQHVLDGALAPSPEDRYAAVEAFARGLADAVAEWATPGTAQRPVTAFGRTPVDRMPFDGPPSTARSTADAVPSASPPDRRSFWQGALARISGAHHTASPRD